MNEKEQERLKQLAEKEEPTTKALFKKLKRARKARKLDDLVHELHNEAFEEINCLDCANCCKSISPIIHEKDIQRISRHLKIKPSEFTQTYLKLDKEGDFVFQQTPCPFLLPDNYCSIYPIRPKSCKEYPHTDRKNIQQILLLTLKNSFICPAVFKITKRMKDIL